jgi:hypothetical protein
MSGKGKTRGEISLCAGRPIRRKNGKKESARSVRNDGVGVGTRTKAKPAPLKPKGAAPASVLVLTSGHRSAA